MKYLKYVVLLVIFLSCRSLKETKKFSACTFTFGSIKSAKVAGVSILGAKNITDFSAVDGAKLMYALSQRKLVLTSTINVIVENPNKQKASLTKLDWIASIDNVKLSQGTINKKVEVPAQGKSTMPLTISVDVGDVFAQKSSRDVLMKLLKSFNNHKRTTDFIVKAKPYFSVGKKGKMIKSPVYLKMKQSF